MIYKQIFYVLFLVGIIFSFFDLKYLTQNIKRIAFSFRIGLNLYSVLFCIILSFLILNLIICFTPVWDFDTVSYHFAVPKLYIKAHSIFYIPYIQQSNFPFFSEMLYLIGLLFKNEILSLPIFPELKQEEIEFIVDNIKATEI